MQLSPGLIKNFRFLVLEVIKQVDSALHVLDEQDGGAIRKIRSRDDYIDHLKSIIENKCYAYLRQDKTITKATVDTLRSLNVIASNLEHIADHAVSIVGQTLHFSTPSFFHRFDYNPFFQVVFEALEKVISAFHERDTSTALEICRAEVELDRLYKAKFERILAEMSAGGEVANLTTSLFIFHYLERVGDCLENIGEAILFSKMGEKMKVHQFQTLHQAMSARGKDSPAAEGMRYEGIWGTRSGAVIGKISNEATTSTPGGEVIFKEGEPSKILKEKENLERWSRLVPGLAPRVVDFQQNEGDAALLIEYLKGSTFQEIAINIEPDRLEEALFQVQLTLREIWRETKQEGAPPVNFLGQLHVRLDDVLAVHPAFAGRQQQIGGLTIPGFKAVLEDCLPLDKQLVAPFSVFGHGDFNLDNIIYNADTQEVHFIDVHRSEQMDFAQDISVLAVSAFRLPVFEPELRDRLNRIARSFYRMARDFAEENGDRSFPARMAAGLVRSFVSSTRFEFQRAFAEEMMLRATYLLKRLRDHGARPWEDFHLPEDVMLY